MEVYVHLNEFRFVPDDGALQKFAQDEMHRWVFHLPDFGDDSTRVVLILGGADVVGDSWIAIIHYQIYEY